MNKGKFDERQLAIRNRLITNHFWALFNLMFINFMVLEFTSVTSWAESERLEFLLIGFLVVYSLRLFLVKNDVFYSFKEKKKHQLRNEFMIWLIMTALFVFIFVMNGLLGNVVNDDGQLTFWVIYPFMYTVFTLEFVLIVGKEWMNRRA